MHEETVSYGEIGIESSGSLKNKKNKSVISYLKKTIGLSLLGVLLGRASILGGLSPFGLAYYASLSGLRINAFLVFVGINIGTLTLGLSTGRLKYIFASLLFSMISISSPLENKKNRVVAFRAFISIFIVGTILILFKGFLLYDFLFNLFESSMTFVLVMLFRNATPFVERNEKREMTSEQIITVTLLFVLTIIGLPKLIFMGLALKNILIISLIIIFSLRNGPAVGASIGIISGMIVSMAVPTTPLVIGVYGFCGLISGVFKDLGKAGCILGFILANAIITIYINGSTEVLINLADILGATAIITIIPRKLITNLSDTIIKPPLAFLQRKSKIEKVKDITSQRLLGFSESFAQLANTFNRISQKNVNMNKDDISTLFDEVAERVCRDCNLNNICWTKEFYNTYQVMFKILEKLEQKGSLDRYDVPEYFKEKCVRLDEFIKNTNFMFELYSANVKWQERISESRYLIAQQLEGVSKIISELAEEVNEEVCFEPELEKRIQMELIKSEIRVDEVMVVKNRYGKYEISIAHEPCDNKRTCIQTIIPVISKVLGKKVIKEDIMCSTNTTGVCVVRLIEQQNYKVVTGVSTASKDFGALSGDNHSVIQLKDGKVIVVLSDGMGSGDKAAKESSAAIALLEKFLQSGFDIDISIKLINSVLILKSAEESFATIDLSIIDLFTGEVEFAKIGAATTFIKRPDRIEVVKSTSLPVGILSNVDMELSKKKLEDGDLLIMVSDGVLDSMKDIVKKEEWIIHALTNISTNNPQEIADYLIEKAKENFEGQEKDDMTVLTARVLEKVS